MATGHVRDVWIAKRSHRRTAKYGTGRRWQAVWVVDGRETTKSFDRKVDAERHLAVTITSQLRGDYVDPRSGRITVREYADRWLAEKLRLRPGSRARYRSHLDKHILPALGHLAVGDVRRSTVQGMVSALAASNLAPATVKSIARTTSIIFRAAVADQVIARSPYERIELPEAAESKAEILTIDQVRALAEHMPPYLKAVPVVGAQCGLRPGELLGLELDPARGLDMLGRRILVRQQLVSELGRPPYLGLPKTAAGVREVPLADETLAALAKHLAEHPPVEVTIEDRTGHRPKKRTARLVFLSGRGQPWRRWDFNHAWNNAVDRARAAGVELPERITPHIMRHTYASLLIRHNENVKVVQARLGHATAAETLDTYSHLWKDSADRTRQAISEAFAQEELPGLRVVE